MFADNVKIKTHVRQIKDNAFSDRKARNQLIYYAVAVMIYCLMAAYLGLRGWQAFGLQIYLPLYILILGAITLVLPVAAYLLDQGREARPIPQIIAYAGFYWTAFFLYAVLLMVALDVIRILNRVSHQQLTRLLPSGFPTNLRSAVYLILITIAIMLTIGTMLARRPRITGYLLKVDKDVSRSRPLRIALLSDIHYGSLVSTANLKILCSKVQAQEPDLILLAGDLIDNSLQLIMKTDFISQMASLQAPLGVFAVLGNHELVNADKQEIVNFYRGAGIKVLLDEIADIDGQLVLAGRNERQMEFSGSLHRQTPYHLLNQVDQSKLVILMQHQPVDLDELDRAGVDIAVAGHTHRGQLFPLNLLNRRHFLQTRSYLRLNRLQSIISAGYGTWGPPIRLGSRSEIVIIDLIGNQIPTSA